MALHGKFVIDSVTHAFDSRPENIKAGRYAELVLQSNFRSQWTLMPEKYRLSRDRYFQRMTPEALASVLFVESATDIAFYHSIPAWGVFNDLSPIGVAMEIRERHPGRMYLYGAVSPLEGSKALDDLTQQVNDWNIEGVKLYPIDVIQGKMQSFQMSDEKIAYPLFAKCVELGVRSVAVHKAIPLGTAPMDPFRPGDVDYAARDFPELNFELVHGGFAFLEETALQIARFENVYVNLETTASLLVRYPEKFARIIGELLLANGREKVFWGTGAAQYHPAPVLEAFARFEMPAELQEREGYPEVSEDVKADILANNFARAHGLDLAAIKTRIQDDELALMRQAGEEEPWRQLPDRGPQAAGE